MNKEYKTPDKRNKTPGKQRIIRRTLLRAVFIIVFIVVFIIAAVWAYNNVSLCSDEAFAKRIDIAIEKALTWTKAHRAEILKRRNIGLIKMLKEIEKLRATSVFSDIIGYVISTPARPKCWSRLVDPNCPVDELELNITINKESLDNKWVLYAIAPDKAKITPEQMHLFDRNRWQGRKLTHQLDALIILRRTSGPSKELDELIEHLCNRLKKELVFDIPVVDIYIQKVTFILRAGLPQKVRRRWLERIIANQLPDGGWNDRWFCFMSDSKRPLFDFNTPPSNQHATLQALTALFLVRYRYPEYFGLK